MNCLLTGATGIVGSHILFDWIRKALVEQTVNHIFVVIRGNDLSSEERLVSILTSESRPAFMNYFSLAACLEKITVISGDLMSLQEADLLNHPFDTVIHCAGSTNLLNTSESKNKVHTQNYLVTQHLLQNLPAYVTRFLYISTAYSFGIQNKKVDDHINSYQVTDFRNPYEKSKYECETYVVEACKTKGINAQILRPSIICGRLLDRPYFETPKFDVFYSWAIFLDKYAKQFKDTFRIWIDKQSGLNIVPVDFVSKAVLHAFLNPEIKELNIVNPKQILHKDYVGCVLESFNINTYEYAEEKPENLSVFEQLYYKSIGGLFEKYISIPDLQFKPEQIMKLIEQLQLDLTLGVHENFMNLIDFSVEKRFRNSY